MNKVLCCFSYVYFIELIKIATTEKYYAKNPKDDIREGGIVAIDFGTKSTVVAIQTQNEKTSLVRRIWIWS